MSPTGFPDYPTPLLGLNIHRYVSILNFWTCIAYENDKVTKSINSEEVLNHEEYEVYCHAPCFLHDRGFSNTHPAGISDCWHT